MDGQPAVMERANLAFRAVYVPQGTHTVRWTYRPASYRVGHGSAPWRCWPLLRRWSSSPSGANAVHSLTRLEP